MLTSAELANIQQRDLYWCEPDPADTVGSEQRKDRVWVVLSVARLHRGNCVVGLPLTTELSKARAHLMAIPKEEIRMVGKDAAVDCVALTDQIRALDKRRFRRKAGTISERAFTAIIMLGLDRLFGR